jgi:hypothetical protein
MFLLFINDISTVINNSKFLLFADDLKLFHCIESPEDCAKLQLDVDNLCAWSSVNRLPFSIKKCHSMIYSRSRAPIRFNYVMYEQVLPSTELVTDLGVQFQTDYRFHQHISDMCCRAYKMLGFVVRYSHQLQSPGALCTLYNHLVRSILENTSLVWSPSDVSDSSMIEKVSQIPLHEGI